jgi:hypothetical protein
LRAGKKGNIYLLNSVHKTLNVVQYSRQPGDFIVNSNIATTVPQKPSDAWRNFTYFTTAASILCIGGLIFWADINPLLKVAISVSTAWGLSNVASVTKLLRDKQEYEDWEKASKPEPVRTTRLPQQAEA